MLVFDDLTTVLRQDGLLEISALPADTSFRLAHGQRVPVELSTSSGDIESVDLYRFLCPARESIMLSHGVMCPVWSANPRPSSPTSILRPH
jgi:hypothetical protein